MSLDSDLEFFPALCLKWKVDVPNEYHDEYAYSSEFRFQGKQCRLAFKFKFCWDEHCLRLQNMNEGYHGPFDAVVEVENGTGQIQPELKSEVQPVNQDFPFIWWRTEAEVVRGYPEFGRNNRELRFRVLLKACTALIVKDSTLFSSADSVQTTSYVRCLESLSEDFSKLLGQGPNPDVEFECVGQSTKAHGAVVSARSQVIAKMLATDMVEGRTKVVKIPDLRPNVFEKFLKYLYTGKLDGLTFEVALNLFEAGDQYAVTGLAKRCSEYVVRHLSVQNACEVLVIADAHSDEGLVEKVVDYMVDKRVPVACEAWPAFCDEHPSLAIKVLSRRWKDVVK